MKNICIEAEALLEKEAITPVNEVEVYETSLFYVTNFKM